MSGNIYASNIASIGHKVVACADTTLEKAKIDIDWHNARASADAMEVIRDDKVEIVVITSPLSTRADYVLSAIDAGKHVFCEAPLTQSGNEAARIFDAAQSASAKVFVAHTTRYDRPYQALAAQIESGAIGTPGFAKTYRDEILGPGKDIIFDLLIHDFDWLASILGPVETIFCQHLGEQNHPVSDYAMTTLTFSSGALAQCIGTSAQSLTQPLGSPVGTLVFPRTVEIVGDAGLVQYDSAETPIQVTRYEGQATDTSSPLDDFPHTSAWNDFLNYVEHDTEPKSTLSSAVEAVRMAEAAHRSIETSTPQALDR